MKVTCSKCQAEYQIDPSKIPPKGAVLTCRKCQNRIPVEAETVPQDPPEPAPVEEASAETKAPAKAMTNKGFGGLRGFVGKAKDESERLKKSAVEKSEALKKSAADAIDLKEVGLEKIKEISGELNTALPYFKRVGYNFEELEVELGLPPKLNLLFKHIENVGQEAQQEVLGEIKEMKTAHMIISSLLKANSLQDIIRIGNLKFSSIQIELTAIPSVKLKFN